MWLGKLWSVIPLYPSLLLCKMTQSPYFWDCVKNWLNMYRKCLEQCLTRSKWPTNVCATLLLLNYYTSSHLLEIKSTIKILPGSFKILIIKMECFQKMYHISPGWGTLHKSLCEALGLNQHMFAGSMWNAEGKAWIHFMSVTRGSNRKSIY